MKKIKIFSVVILIIIILSLNFCFINNDSNLVNINDIMTDSKYMDITYNNEEDILQEDVLGILIIDKIGLKATVKEGTSKSILNKYIGHIENTSIYDGNIGLAGHNKGYKYSYFARINELEIGDVITYKTKFYIRQYKVDNIKVILDNDWSLLENTTENKITLITCIKNKKNQRLCVQAKEIAGNDL